MTEPASGPRIEAMALIPARGGSKSVPRKNVRIVGGKPLIAWSIEDALKATRVTRVIVSTDDDEIAEIARAWGAEVPFRRPAEISGDVSVDYDFHRHALEWLRKEEGYEPEQVVLLRPTTPDRHPAVIDAAIGLFAAHPEADSLRSVSPASFSPYKMWRLQENGYLTPVVTLEGRRESYNLPRQLLPQAWHHDGYIDITRPRTVFELGSVTGSVVLPFMIQDQSIDIDVEQEIDEADRVLLNRLD
ncbi:cytidylyltransferase domain-containing protein [Azospirillum thermophilum]|nr:acylneuraminate cytidylyltransferase family protein [Azospirillum thermophilum]